MTPSQTRTNHLGYDVGPSRKIADGALARATTTECLKANKSNALTRLALMLFRLLCFSIGVVKAALKAAAAAITARPTDRGGAPPALFQLQVKVDGATVMLDAGSAWTAADVKAALHAKTGRASGGYYLVAAGGKPLDDGAATTLAALGVGPGDRLELRGRLRGGMGCGASKRPAGPAPAAGKMVEAGAAAGAAGRAAAEAAAATAAVEKAAEESPALPAQQQQAGQAKEAELAARPELTPSYWDEVGDGKPNASVLKRALADTVLVDAAWLARLADAGDILPRCQDLPEGARVTLDEMEQWTHLYTVGVLVISYPWWATPPSTRPTCLERPARRPCPASVHVAHHPSAPPGRAQARRRPPRQGRAAAARDLARAEDLRQDGQGDVRLRRRLQGGRVPRLRLDAAALAGQRRGRPHARGEGHL